MSVSPAQAKAFTGAYSIARKSGLLETRAGQWLFSRAYFLYKRHIEDQFHSLAAHHPELFRGGNVLDVGANIGYTSAIFARAIDPEYHVYSFEPEEYNFRLLDRLAKSGRGHGRIIPVRAAVGDRNGTVELWRNDRHHGDHRVVTAHFQDSGAVRDSVQVPLLSIDHFVQTQNPAFPVCFIKIDVQGYELPVCRGMEATLARNPDAVVTVEYSPVGMRELGFQPEELIAWFSAMNLRAHVLRQNGAISKATPADVANESYTDLLFARRAL
jgi:FkbM family methyltransferase